MWNVLVPGFRELIEEAIKPLRERVKVIEQRLEKSQGDIKFLARCIDKLSK